MDRRRLFILIWLLWFLAIDAIFFVAGNRNAAAFAFLFVFVFGGISYRYRSNIKRFLLGAPGPRAIKFFGAAFIVAAAEEIFCYLSGNRIAIPVLWADVIFCCLVWAGWFGAWYFYLARKYRYGETEALLVAGLSGILYEGFGPATANPLAIGSILLIAPFLALVYAAIFLVPLQLIELTGTKDGPWKYPVSVVLPFLISLPITFALYILFTAAGVPLK